jgi:hypothetical protein
MAGTECMVACITVQVHARHDLELRVRVRNRLPTRDDLYLTVTPSNVSNDFVSVGRSAKERRCRHRGRKPRRTP